MDRGYDPRVRSSPDVQEIDSEQLLNLTPGLHGSGGLFLSAAQTRTIVRFSQLADLECHLILFLLFFC